MPASATEHLAEDVFSTTTTEAELTKDVSEVCVTENVFLRKTLMEGRVAILVVLLFLLCIRENGISFRNFLETFLRLLVIRGFCRDDISVPVYGRLF